MDAFELDTADLAFILGTDPPAEQIAVAMRRAQDRMLLQRGAMAARAFQPMLDAALDSFRRTHPELCKGLSGSAQALFRPTPTKGASAVLVRLIEVILSPESAQRTQEECRAIVQAEFPNHAVYKTWTKPLQPWAVARARALLAGSSPPLSSVRLRTGVTLKELHNAVKAAVAGKGIQATVAVRVTDDAVFVNGHRFKRSLNHAGGKDYPIVRLGIPALEAALQAKSNA